MDTCIDTIVAMEWEAFQDVHNVGGRASCQDDRRTFSIMRKSQFLAWDAETREAYLRDLAAAKEQGRNLLTEKYARMMAYTSPLEYRQLERSLPPVSGEAAGLAEQIAATLLVWQEEYARAYPRLTARGRPVEDNSGGMISFETYLRGELLTYSPETLRRLAAHVSKLRDDGMNMSVELMRHTVRMYGYASLEDAEAAA